jgi:predicted LPLAT superfamily acyltransferase
MPCVPWLPSHSMLCRAHKVSHCCLHRSVLTCLQVLWTFSIYLEAVAILPQLILLQRTQNIDNLTGNYVALLGSYRAFYILNWWANCQKCTCSCRAERH